MKPFRIHLRRFWYRPAGWLSLLLAAALPAAAQNQAFPQPIVVATPQWAGQTNADGSGIFFEILKRVYVPEGVALQYRLVPWKRAAKMVADEQADAMLCVWREQADEWGQWIPRYPIFVEHVAVVFKKGRLKPWIGIGSLDNRRAVWLRGYGYHDYQQFADIRFAEWLEVDDYARAWRLLKMGRCDVYIDALIDIEAYIAKNGVDMRSYRLEILWKENAYLAFAPSANSRALIEVYNRRIRQLAESGELEKIHRRWGVRYVPEAWQPAARPPR